MEVLAIYWSNWHLQILDDNILYLVLFEMQLRNMDDFENSSSWPFTISDDYLLYFVLLEMHQIKLIFIIAFFSF